MTKPEAKELTYNSEITLITLHNCPSDISFIADLFDQIGKLEINIDMISLAPSQGAVTALSFTISDQDLGNILSFTSKLQEQFQIKTVVSNGNYKISVYDPAMRNTPGIASKVFAAAAKANTDIRIITTSEVEISLLVTAADFNDTLLEIQSVME